MAAAMIRNRPQTASSDHWLEAVVRLSDDQFRLPGTNIRFGLDPFLGLLLPGVGDATSTALAFAVIFVAWREGAPPALLTRMLFNVALDTLVGTVPLLGDLFDLAYRANRKNYGLLTQWREGRGARSVDGDVTSSRSPHSDIKPQPGSRLALVLLSVVLILFVLVPLALTLLVGYWLWQ